MSEKSQIKFNLLKSRLKDEGIDRPLMGSNLNIRNKGIFIGSLFIVSTLIASLYVLIRGNIYKVRKQAIEPYARKYDQYIQKIEIANKNINKLSQFNKTLAKSIASLRSSSAILTEISHLIPTSISLKEIKISDASIIITGNANQKSALKHINIFILQLEGSPFIKPNSTKLSHAIESDQNYIASQEQNNDMKRKKLKFTITSELKPDTSKITSNRLQVLGSNGLAHRIKLLNEEELLN